MWAFDPFSALLNRVGVDFSRMYRGLLTPVLTTDLGVS